MRMNLTHEHNGSRTAKTDRKHLSMMAEQLSWFNQAHCKKKLHEYCEGLQILKMLAWRHLAIAMHDLKGLSSEMEEGIKFVSIDRCPFKQWPEQHDNSFFKGKCTIYILNSQCLKAFALQWRR